MNGFQKRLSQPGAKQVSLAMIHIISGGVQCSCGWTAIAARNKVAEDKAERHLRKRHGGRGLWM